MDTQPASSAPGGADLQAQWEQLREEIFGEVQARPFSFVPDGVEEEYHLGYNTAKILPLTSSETLEIAAPAVNVSDGGISEARGSLGGSATPVAAVPGKRTSSAGLCVLCQHSANILIPCGHHNVCEGCADRFLQHAEKLCPTCMKKEYNQSS